MEEQNRVLVLGIGNLLWADEGFGVRAVEALHRGWTFADHVTLMDGGTQGFHLVEHVRAAKILVVFDAVDYGMPPGDIRLVEGADVPAFLGAKKMSLHQTGFQDVLAMAEMFGELPPHLLLIGVQPEMLEDYGGSLRPIVKAQIEPAIGHALDWLARFGIQAERRDPPLPDHITLSSPEIALSAYESGRPGETQAYRHGDARFVFAEAGEG
jgi:hydrogenase maturation protease